MNGENGKQHINQICSENSCHLQITPEQGISYKELNLNVNAEKKQQENRFAKNKEKDIFTSFPARYNFNYPLMEFFIPSM